MELKDDVDIPAPRDVVYKALNDPEILKQCIPGCDELIKHSDTELEAKVALKVGPVKAKFSGNVTLDTEGAPDQFSLTGEGSGGAAGFAKGKADVTLEEIPEGTRLSYVAHADMGGKIAQLGSRLIDSTAKKLAGQFFKKFADIVASEQVAPTETETDTKTGTEAKAASHAEASPALSAQPEIPSDETEQQSNRKFMFVLIGFAILLGLYIFT